MHKEQNVMGRGLIFSIMMETAKFCKCLGVEICLAVNDTEAKIAIL